MNWMILPLKRYAEFSGRSRRMEYWMFTLLNVIVILVLAFLVAGVGGAGGMFEPGADPSAAMGSLFGGMGLLIVLWILAVFIPSIAVSVRRLHDRDMSGWWYLAFLVGGLIPYIGFLISIGFLVLMLLPGTVGPNRFGADPKGGADVGVFE